MSLEAQRLVLLGAISELPEEDQTRVKELASNIERFVRGKDGKLDDMRMVAFALASANLSIEADLEE